jgi:hypothetical protein
MRLLLGLLLMVVAVPSFAWLGMSRLPAPDSGTDPDPAP